MATKVYRRKDMYLKFQKKMFFLKLGNFFFIYGFSKWGHIFWKICKFYQKYCIFGQWSKMTIVSCLKPIKINRTPPFYLRGYGIIVVYHLSKLHCKYFNRNPQDFKWCSTMRPRRYLYAELWCTYKLNLSCYHWNHNFVHTFFYFSHFF